MTALNVQERNANRLRKDKAMNKNDDLIRELRKRGSAELDLNNGTVNQVTQALDEKEDEVKFLVFGDMVTRHIRPIEETCISCTFWKGKFANTQSCQTEQAKDSKARGFSKLVCPHQFIEDYP